MATVAKQFDDEMVVVRMTMSEARELLTVLDDAEHARVRMGDAPSDVQEGLRALVTSDVWMRG